jgi:hypothetical protein
MADQVNKNLDEQKPAADIKPNPEQEDKATAIDSAKPKLPADVIEPAA